MKSSLIVAAVTVVAALPKHRHGFTHHGPRAVLSVGAVSDCTSSGALAQNFKVTTNSSDTVHVGDYVGLTFDFDLEQEITAGTVYYNATVNGFLPYNTVDDLCTDQANGPDPCPLAVGHHTDVGVVQVPSGVTKLKSTIQWVDASGTEILCATATWDVAASVDAVPLPKELTYERVPAAVAAKAQAARPFAGKPVVGSVADCTSTGSLAQNFVVTTNSSDSVAVGDYVGLTFDFDLEQEITAGTVYYNATVNGFLPYNTVDDLCTDQANGPDPCPLAVGHHTDVGVVQVPSGVTKLKSTIQWVDASGTEILCATAQWDVTAAADAAPVPLPLPAA